MVKVLRIGNSNDNVGGIPEAQRGWSVASRMLGEASGEVVETILKRAWPNASFPALVDEWMAEHDPDVVLIQVNNFWYGHYSAPLWFERKFGRAGVAMTRAGLRAGKHPWLAENAAYIRLNRALLRILPSTTHFTVREVAASMEATMRKVLSYEGTLLVIRGNDHWAKLPMSSKRQNDRNIARNVAMSNAMRAICQQLRVPYIERESIGERDMDEMLGVGRWHASALSQRVSGELDGAAMVSAWAAAKG